MLVAGRGVGEIRRLFLSATCSFYDEFMLPYSSSPFSDLGVSRLGMIGIVVKNNHESDWTGKKFCFYKTRRLNGDDWTLYTKYLLSLPSDILYKSVLG